MSCMSYEQTMAEEIKTLKHINELLNADLGQNERQVKNQAVTIGCQAKQVGQLQQQVEYLTQCRIELERYNWWDRCKAAAIAVVAVELGRALVGLYLGP